MSRIISLFALVTACTNEPGDAPRIDSTAAAAERATELCNKPVVFSGTNYRYAEHAYPGKTVSDLSRLVVIGHVVPANTFVPPGYTHYTSLAVLKDGSAAVVCGPEASPVYDNVEFVLFP